MMPALFDQSLRCPVVDGDWLGPVIARTFENGANFTLVFEETIFTLLPVLVLSIVGAFRILHIAQASDRVNRSWLYTAKAVECSLLASIDTNR